MNTIMNRVKPGSIVVGVDGSAAGDVALKWAVEHATSRRRPLVIVHGAGDPRNSSEFLGTVEAARVLRKAARRVTDKALSTVRTLAPDLDVQVIVRLRDPRFALLELSDGASMLVVGTRGHGPVRALLLGSVSVAVATHSSCPVAVIRRTSAGPGVAVGHVVVGIDAGPLSSAALEFAFEMASTEHRDLDVVHNWSTNDTFIDSTSYEQRVAHTDTHHHMLIEALSGYAEKYPDVTVHRHLPDGAPAATLGAISQTAAAVVVGSRGRSGMKGLLGSVSRSVVERAQCTVIVVRS